jgi:hypothetical protein
MSNKQSGLKQAKKKEIEAQKEAKLWEWKIRIMDKMTEELFKNKKTL